MESAGLWLQANNRGGICYMIAYVVVVENMAGTVMPETGGIGTTTYVFTGALLMAVSVLLLLAKKRRAI